MPSKLSIDRKGYRFSVFALFFICLLAPAWADTVHESVRREAAAYLQANLPSLTSGRWQVEVNPVDARLRLAPCQQPLAMQSPRLEAGHTVVQVRCGDQPGWQLYVPARIQQLLPQVVARETLPPGTIIEADMLEVVEQTVRSGRGRFYSQIDGLDGARVKRTLAAGNPVLPSYICLVCKKDTVNILARRGGLVVKSQGTALSDGTLGQAVSVKNSGSGRQIRARVSGLGEVEVIF